MTSDVYIFEAAKLFFQLAGASLVAWISVRWALRRYKSEKLWERRLAAYTGILSAIAEMQRVLDRHEYFVATHREMSDDEDKSLNDAYNQALKAIVIANGEAAILLPDKVLEIIKSLPTDLSNASHVAGDWYENINNRWSVLSTTWNRIIEEAGDQFK